MSVSSVSLSADQILRQALASKGLRYVGIRGDPKSPVCILGEAPGKDEDRIQLPFVGASGQLLDQMLKESCFEKDTVWFTNPYKTRPPDNDLKRLGELNVPNEFFINQFFEELTTYHPTIIVACGRTPTQLLCPETKPKVRGAKAEEREGFGNWRGSLLISPFLNWPHYVIPMYHPAYVLRNYEEREICRLILDRAFEEYRHVVTNGKLQPLPIRNLIVNPSFQDAYTFLNRCIISTEPISIDIELLKRQVPYTISFALSPQEAVSLSFWNYAVTELKELWRLMDRILNEKRQIGQNYTSFDAHWLRALGFSVNLRLVEDTLIRHHILWPGLPHKLQFQGMQYTRQPYWKEEGKGWSLKEGLDRLMHYNALDAACTYEVYLRQEEEFVERG
jgi:uracil-DNA glycosylase